MVVNDGYHLVMTNIAMERSTMKLIGKPSISMSHRYHGYVSHNQRVYKVVPQFGIAKLGAT